MLWVHPSTSTIVEKYKALRERVVDGDEDTDSTVVFALGLSSVHVLSESSPSDCVLEYTDPDPRVDELVSEPLMVSLPTVGLAKSIRSIRRWGTP
jgi:hypothetical protein